mmetsp:Transcript_35325/g.77216  ORF Transcript_35325/g.77216 Transcript_35325/m.77216 type:complete len:226 (+) Transcript_35325:1293-1970(+)
MSRSLKLRLAFSEGTPEQMFSSGVGMVLPGHCEQLAAFLQLSVAKQYSFSCVAQVAGELETDVMPDRAPFNFSCISIQTCMFPIFVFLPRSSRGHFLAQRFRRVTLSFPTEAALQVEASDEMWSKRVRERLYLYLLLECLPRPVKLNVLLLKITEGSVTSRAPGAFHRTVYLIVKKMQESFCAHWKAGVTCCARPYFGFSVRSSSSASSFNCRTAFLTAKDKSTC